MADAVALLLLLIGLELVLGVDNILVISIFVSRLPASHKNRARIIGLGLALAARILVLFILLTLSQPDQHPDLPLFNPGHHLDCGGGCFSCGKPFGKFIKPLPLKTRNPKPMDMSGRAFFSFITQIVLLDIVFSIDSVITAIGLTNEIWIIIHRRGVVLCGHTGPLPGPSANSS